MSNAVKALRAVRVAMLAALLGLPAQAAVAQETAIALPLNDAALVQPRHVTVKAARYRGSDALEDTFAFVPGLDFHDGTIEVDVAGAPLPDAPANARGFVGIAFRIDEQDGTFACEGLYIRPSNGRAGDQLRRNRSTQYFSYPGHDFDRLRREAPGQYESYVDLEVGEWTHLRIEVAGAQAQLYVGGAAQPALIVNDLKRGADAHGTVGLFVGIGADGHFRNLSVRPR
jgi:hypothetical protein